MEETSCMNVFYVFARTETHHVLGGLNAYDGLMVLFERSSLSSSLSHSLESQTLGFLCMYVFKWHVNNLTNRQGGMLANVRDVALQKLLQI